MFLIRTFNQCSIPIFSNFSKVFQRLGSIRRQPAGNFAST